MEFDVTAVYAVHAPVYAYPLPWLSVAMHSVVEAQETEAIYPGAVSAVNETGACHEPPLQLNASPLELAFVPTAMQKLVVGQEMESNM